ncbi:Glycylpeptide N-tetradecanoyltransferase 2 [Chionoecetes opilio]|uniref:Myristoyl-CoA:protein N-myristoyltransferase n=1 Tax=Chionoecetes opilio TaxID=41210 RepID=A0A8J4Y2P1_CHIOP|nr:Glycylpeptide N-tetradecanoyltransferase 2 [Chionoecetes opilio]
MAASDKEEDVSGMQGRRSKPKKKKKTNKGKKDKADGGVAVVNGESEPSTSGIAQISVASMSADGTTGEEQVLPEGMGIPQVEQYMRKMQLQEQKEFLFWNTQPVPKITEDIEEGVNEAIEGEKTVSEIKQESYNLPDGFFWDTLDLLNPDVVSGALLCVQKGIY